MQLDSRPIRSSLLLLALAASFAHGAPRSASPAPPGAAGDGIRLQAEDRHDAGPQAPASGSPRGTLYCGDDTITQSTNPNTVAPLTIWCGTTTVSAQNAVARGFVATDSFNIECVTFGIHECSGGDWPVRVRVLLGQTSDPYESLTLISETEILIPDGANRELFTIETGGVLIDAGVSYIVELSHTSRLVEDGGDGGLINFGFNNLGQSAPTYFRAPACAVDEFVTMQSIGYGNRHLVMSLGVAVPDCYVCNPPSPGDRVESEAYCVTTTNGGCDIPNPAFTRISDECTWCGNLWLNDPDYDTDWYRFDLSAPGMVTIDLAVDASFGVIVEVYEASGCPVGPAELVDTYDVRCYPGLSSRSNFFNAGAYLIRLVPGTLLYGPYSNSGIICDYGVNYRLAVQGVPGSCEDEPVGGPCEPIALQDPSFESAPLNSYVAVLNNFTTLVGQWGAENGAIVTGTVDGVSPSHASKMLRLLNDGLSFSQVVQVVDLTSIAGQIDAGGLQATFAASFNASNGVSAPAAYAMLRYYSGPGLIHQTGTDAQSMVFDGNPATWERHSVTGTIPVGTRWMVVEIGFNNSTIASLAGFVDDADLCIRPRNTDNASCQIFWTASMWQTPGMIKSAGYSGSGANLFYLAGGGVSPQWIRHLAFTKQPSPRVYWADQGPMINHAPPGASSGVPSVLPTGALCDPQPMLAASNTDLYYGCPVSLTIHRVQQSSPFTTTPLPLTPAQIGTLRAMVFDQQNNRLLIARDGPSEGEIWAYDPVTHAYTYLDSVNPGSASIVHSMDLDRFNGNLYVLGTYSPRFTPDQHFIRRMTLPGAQTDVLLNPPGMSGSIGYLTGGWHAIAVDALAGRMWWTTLNNSLVAQVRTATLNGASPSVIATGLPGEIFEGLVVTRCCPVDLNGDGILDLIDIVDFISAFVAFDPIADLSPPFGIFDLADLVGFISSFSAGCP